MLGPELRRETADQLLVGGDGRVKNVSVASVPSHSALGITPSIISSTRAVSRSNSVSRSAADAMSSAPPSKNMADARAALSAGGSHCRVRW